MRISFAAPGAAPKSGYVAVFVSDDGKLGKNAAALDKAAGGALAHAMAAAEFTGKKGSILTVPGPKGISVAEIAIVGLGAAGDLTALNVRDAGGRAIARATGKKGAPASFIVDRPKGSALSEADLAANLAVGAGLGVYSFNTYKTSGIEASAAPKKLSVSVSGTAAARKAYGPLAAVVDGVYLARDLVNEPPNKLFPKSFAAKAKQLAKLGVKVEILGEAQMKKLGMGALLGVGQGSVHESQMVVMQWNGAAKSEKPLAFIGKGICFDTGGISLKPAGGMADMKMDMGGAAAVTGLMHTLASRKAKVNAIGVLALAENMPDGNAQRPSDVVTSMAGKTIEVNNTDAEGRLVLCDALWYTQDRFKPELMIDLATLTGAMIVALAHEYAGVFTNTDKIADQLYAAGQATGDRTWQMPIGPEFTKMLKSKTADLSNISGAPAGGSITAACFLQEFVNDVPWAHIDIAGTAWKAAGSATTKPGATGYGVQLLDRFVADNYEK